MNDLETDLDLYPVERRLVAAGRATVPDTGHKARLRRELLARHRELTSCGRRTNFVPWARLSRVKRLGLTLPPLGAALAASIMLLVVPVLSGHQSLQAAEAQRLSPRLMVNIPRITSWQWTVHSSVGTSTRVERYQAVLDPRRQEVYVKYGQVYFYNSGRWLQPAVNLSQPAPGAYDWEWAFGLLPQALATDDFTILPSQRVDGKLAEGIKKTIDLAGVRAVTVTFWVDRPTASVLRLERDVTAGNREVEHDVVDYLYQRTG